MPIFPKNKIILASSSPRRLALLEQIGIIPDAIIPADINEKSLKKELPKDLALRLSQEKAEKIYKKQSDSFILAADTTVAAGRKLLDKAENSDYARYCLETLSGRKHKVFTGITVISPDGKRVSRLCETSVQFKKLSQKELKQYIESGEWEGKAGGYGIQGRAGAFVKTITGSYSNVMGLSLYDTIQILDGLGYRREG